MSSFWGIVRIRILGLSGIGGKGLAIADRIVTAEVADAVVTGELDRRMYGVYRLTVEGVGEVEKAKRARRLSDLRTAVRMV